MVSILIPCYNSQRWIAQAIESALAQTWPEKEVIVVDDGSSDGSVEIIKQFEGRIRWESGPNRGGNAARNRLLELAEGEWVQYLDADDYLLPEKIEKQMQFLATHLDNDVVFGPVTMEHWTPQGSRRELHHITSLGDNWILLASWQLPQTGAPIWRRQAILEVGGWKNDQPCCQEHELYLRLLMGGKRFIYCPHNGAIYRQWSEDTVCKRNKSETHRRRLDILQRLETFLSEKQWLTKERLTATNQARFETARSVWQYDPHFSSTIIRTIHLSQPGFVPHGESAPLHYRWTYRAFGLEVAERLATVKRKLLSA